MQATTTTNMTTTTAKFAAQLNASRSSSKESKRVRRDDPRMATYWERYDEDMARTEEEWDALLAQTKKETNAQREKVMAKLAASRYAKS
jgi:hypothetical protein